MSTKQKYRVELVIEADKYTKKLMRGSEVLVEDVMIRQKKGPFNMFKGTTLAEDVEEAVLEHTDDEFFEAWDELDGFEIAQAIRNLEEST